MVLTTSPYSRQEPKRSTGSPRTSGRPPLAGSRLMASLPPGRQTSTATRRFLPVTSVRGAPPLCRCPKVLIPSAVQSLRSQADRLCRSQEAGHHGRELWRLHDDDGHDEGFEYLGGRRGDRAVRQLVY